MKLSPTLLSVVFSALAASSSLTVAHGGLNYGVPVTSLILSNLSSGSISPSLGATTNNVPRGTKTYVTSLRPTAVMSNFCAAALISPTHVLTAAGCVEGNIRWASIGSYYNNGTEDGEQIKVVAILNHPNHSASLYDFSVLQLEKPSSIRPVALAASDGSDVKDSEWATKLGWYNTGGEEQRAHELQRAEVQLISNEECSKQTKVDESTLCSRALVPRQLRWSCHR